MVLACGALLAGCSFMGSSPNPSQAPGQQQAGFTRFTDIPMPPDNKVDLDKTMVFGVDRDWIGRVSLYSGNNVGDIYDFYKREMPRLGWTELTSVRSSTSVLTYQMENRIATIQVSSGRLIGSVVEFWMNPKANTGASSFGGGVSSFAPAAGPGPRGAVEQQSLPPIVRR
jgi:hypothetical protein